MKKYLVAALAITALVFTLPADAGHRGKGKGKGKGPKGHKPPISVPHCPPGDPAAECSDSGELSLAGVVEIFCDIEVAANPEAADLDILGGEAGTVVASVAETSNNPDGYEVTVSSLNDGALVNSVDSGATVPYQISYDGGPLVAPATAPSVVKNSGPIAGVVTDTSDVEITFAGQPTARAGTYEDVLTFTLTAL